MKSGIVGKIVYRRFLPILFFVWGTVVLLSSCSFFSGESRETLFENVPSSSSNVNFTNELSPTNAFNSYTYANFYSGGGVGLGDFNNDGLLDIYLTANQKDNKLYLNEGDFTFTDITEKAGVGGDRAWSTGVSVVDINGDGWLDIYVCNAGEIRGDDRRNELFINNGDLTFTERAEEYGIADRGLSIHASFFDYDKDGDLDMYLLNYTSQSIGSFDLERNLRDERGFKGGDRFYRNELIQPDTAASGHSGSSEKEIAGFTEVTQEAGIYSSDIGFGLGVSVGDMNRDGWQDIFISNDFFERDYLYLNNRDGTFREVLEQQMESISTTSMGGDIADLNNDGYPEIFVTDMLPENDQRLKTITTFADWEQYQFELEHDYYHQMTRNVLQLNNGNGTFSEIGRYAGVEATAWSWGALISDFNMDGERDIFVPNGIYKDMTDQDHLLHVTQPEVRNSLVQNNRVNYQKLLEMTPTNPIPNYMFEQTDYLRFTNRAPEWGLDQPGFSHGSAYGDLDNDGDMDLVVNNVNAKSSVYRNQTRENYPERTWLQLELEGQAPNSSAVGSQVALIAGGKRWHTEQMPVRGYQSTVDPKLHFGLGGVERIDTLWVQWPDGRLSRVLDAATNQLLTLSQDQAREDTSWTRQWNEQSRPYPSEKPPQLEDITDTFAFDWQHRENEYIDFDRQPLLFHARSTEGPPLCTGDLNGDGRQDFFVGGARGQPGALFLQTAAGEFQTARDDVFKTESGSEDTDCALFDANGDGAEDLYVASGGSDFANGDSALADRLYLNEGQGTFRRSTRAFSSLKSVFNQPTGAVVAGDYNSDGNVDLFVGFRMQPGAYGIPAGGYLLENDGSGRFRDVTEDRLPGLSEAGLITDAAWGDVDGDQDPDLLITGEWMPVRLFRNNDGTFVEATGEAGLDSTHGWWNSIELTDLDGDGDMDWIGGNHGLNSRFEATPQQPIELWVNDFNRDGNFEQIMTSYKNGESYPVALRHDLLAVLPMLESKVPSYHAYAETTVRELFNEQQLEESIHLKATMLSSSVGRNNGNGQFTVTSLPMEAQLSPMYGIFARDFNGDDHAELLMGGNLYRVKPQAGRYDASYGVMLRQDSTGRYRSVSHRESGFFVDGEIRAIHPLRLNGQQVILIARNNKPLQVLKIREP
ncbi:VCBS repeat-containing protein [Fodinibius sp.]|uniref:VCBS repeat-containing protein n=1 Tax=Fodinibius sp. TaxID=1872440 RepID=UPI0035668FE7